MPASGERVAASGDTKALGSVWSCQSGHGGGQPRLGGSLRWKPFVLPGVRGAHCHGTEPGRDESGSGGNRSGHGGGPGGLGTGELFVWSRNRTLRACVCRPGTEVPDAPSQHPECQCPWERSPPASVVPACGAQRPAVLPRVQSLRLHHELDLAHLGASTDLNEGRARRRAWQRSLNCQVQHAALQLLVDVFRYRRAAAGSPGWTRLRSSPL